MYAVLQLNNTFVLRLPPKLILRGGSIVIEEHYPGAEEHQSKSYYVLDTYPVNTQVLRTFYARSMVNFSLTTT